MPDHAICIGEKIAGPIEVGDRVGRWVLLAKGTKQSYFKARCDCGTEREVYKGQLRAGQTLSCGCMRSEMTRERLRGIPPAGGLSSTDGQRARMAALTKERWEAGGYATPAFQRHVEKLRLEHIGTAERGLNIKGPTNKNAKYFRLLSPLGVVLEGMNLQHLVRENADMFDAGDVVWRRNKYGTPTTCLAVLKLYPLFYEGEHRRKSWKGWTALPRP